LVERDAALDDAGVRVTSREGELALRLNDPAAVARDAVRAALAAVAEPLALVNLLDVLAREPQDLVLALVEDLAALADPRAVAVLAPLAQAADPDLAVSAVLANSTTRPRPKSRSMTARWAAPWSSPVLKARAARKNSSWCG